MTTTWTKPDQHGVSIRHVGGFRLIANISGWWFVEEGNVWRAGRQNLTDLASAQAAADAACEALLREAMADFGLVFGAAREVGFGVVERYAIANDGRLYTVRTQRVDGIIVKVRWFTQPDTEFGAEGECATESDAIAAARAHDEQRRGAK